MGDVSQSVFHKDLQNAPHTLFTPIKIGTVQPSHRIVMAPLTRLRSSDEHVPMDIVKTYYSQRASIPGTLLITEATFISEESRGRDSHAPGIFNVEQIAKWKTIVDAVHEKGSYIFCQLWHVGRAAREQELQRLGLDCVSSSAVPMPEPSTVQQFPSLKFATPRAMTEDEIQQTITDFATAATNVVHEAGFDGVEIHAANGYLIDQFTQPACNQRTDRWGGSVENRARFCIEVIRAVCKAVGGDRVGLRLSPFSRFQGMGMDDPRPQFTYLIDYLKQFKLAYLHLIEPRVSGNMDRQCEQNESLSFAIKAWNKTGPIILAGGHTPSSARKAVEEDYADEDIAIAFGRQFISNPDLPRRIQEGIKLSPYNRETFYAVQSPTGYIDYEFAPD